MNKFNDSFLQSCPLTVPGKWLEEQIYKSESLNKHPALKEILTRIGAFIVPLFHLLGAVISLAVIPLALVSSIVFWPSFLFAMYSPVFFNLELTVASILQIPHKLSEGAGYSFNHSYPQMLGFRVSDQQKDL